VNSPIGFRRNRWHVVTRCESNSGSPQGGGSSSSNVLISALGPVIGHRSNHTWTGLCSATTLTTLAHVATIQESRHSDSSTRLLAGSRLPSPPHPVVIACEGRPCSTPRRGASRTRRHPESSGCSRASYRRAMTRRREQTEHRRAR